MSALQCSQKSTLYDQLSVAAPCLDGYDIMILFRHSRPCVMHAGALREQDSLTPASHLLITVVTLCGCHGDMSRRDPVAASWMA